VAGEAFRIRDGRPDDADQLTALLLRTRARAMPWLVSPHDEASARWWMEHVLLVDQRVRVAYVGERLLGFSAMSGEWLEQLYVDPGSQGIGVGRALLEEALGASSGRLALHVFTRNTRARRFYEAAGFVLTAESDGSRNEEREPDCTYVWTAPGSRPEPRG
jgi:GNAT superfamily N-acetyltransferase